MGENTPHIDNRYSPIYQRGGTGPAAPRTNGSTPAKPSGQQHVPPAAPPQAAPASRPTAGDPSHIVEVLPEGAAPAPESVQTTRHPILRINPFVVVLWILGAGLLCVGLWALFAPMQVDETSLAGPFPQWIFVVSQSAGGIILGGSILLAAAGVLSGLFWERRRREAAASAS